MNKALLTEIQNKLIETANENGIALADTFKTRDEWMKFVISFTIKAVMDILEVSVDAAYDAVLGDGEYKALANRTWQALQK